MRKIALAEKKKVCHRQEERYEKDAHVQRLMRDSNNVASGQQTRHTVEINCEQNT